MVRWLALGARGWRFESSLLDNFKFKDMSDNKTTSSSGIGFSGLLAILFIALKLTGVIAWSWWWVLAPIWILFVIVVLVLIVIGIAIAVNN